VEIALRHDCLLHAVLALAAFHKVHLLQEPFSAKGHAPGPLFRSERYISAAHIHQRTTHIDSENCDALFGCTAVLFVTSLARPPDDLDGVNSTEFVEWVNLIRGVAAIVRDTDSKGCLGSGPLRIIFNPTSDFPPRKPDVDDGLRICSEMQLDSLSNAIFHPPFHLRILHVKQQAKHFELHLVILAALIWR